MLGPFVRYARWLHTQWPAGRSDALPEVNDDGSTNVRGLYIAGDLTGVPLLKYSVDTGARVVRTITEERGFQNRNGDGAVDLCIIGGGVAGMSAACEAKKRGLSFELLEATEPFSTIVNFPRKKPIYTYPTEFEPLGDLDITANIKEGLVDELYRQAREYDIRPRIARATKVVRRKGVMAVELAGDEPEVRAHRVIVAIGRSGDARRLGVPGEDHDKVFNRLHDPADFKDRDVLVVGGGDAAVEAAVALCDAGGRVTIAHRGDEICRPIPDNMALLAERTARGAIDVVGSSKVLRIDPTEVTLWTNNGDRKLKNDVVFTMIGRDASLDLLRQSRVRIKGEWRPSTWVAFVSFFLFCCFLFVWKGGTWVNTAFSERGWFPFDVPEWVEATGPFMTTLKVTVGEPGFYYSAAYTAVIVIFGYRRVVRRQTPYVKLQTWTLGAIQVLPLFLLPYFILPYLGQLGAFDAGAGRAVADALFPAADYGHGREYWRAFGFILAWPLFIWNFFTDQPLWAWLVIGSLQTFVLIPWMTYKWGKGAYCGWICSCGALAETLGDAHRHKMPHGKAFNRLNLVGQGVLAIALILMVSRIISWVSPDSAVGSAIRSFYYGLLSEWGPLSYYAVVDIFLAGIVGVGFYFWFSGRVWCRFACPLAALMHIYARFSVFRILADKKKCISCNVCTSVCHQGIDVMHFANKGLPMEDPECVRCSACVSSCPTGTLSFGSVDRNGDVISTDRLVASLVHLREK